MQLKKIVILLVGLLSFVTKNLAQQTKVIAHRGYWKEAGSAQNSIRALQLANQIAVYGSEFDVWLTKDDSLIVNHDKFVFLKKLPYHVGKTTYQKLRSVRLKNGEILPSLTAYLNEGKKCSIRLILELKPPAQKKKASFFAQRVVEEVKRHQLANRIEYISFSLPVCEEIIRLDSSAIVFYLNGDLSPKELKEKGFSGLDYALSTMKRNEHWFEEAKKLGLKINVWTVDEKKDIDYLIKKKVDFITTNEPQLAQKMIENFQKKE